MIEETKNVDRDELDANLAELSEQDLDAVAGGSTNDVKGIDIVVRKKPGKPSNAA